MRLVSLKWDDCHEKNAALLAMAEALEEAEEALLEANEGRS